MPNYQKDNIVELAEIFKALSNPNRLKIFLTLATCCVPGTVSLIDSASDVDTVCVGDLGKELNVGKPTISHHVKELRRVGLIRTERRGQKIACWVDPEQIRRLRDFFMF